MTQPGTTQWEFGRFRLDGAQHLLFRDGEIVPLSRKAVDILVTLLEDHGQLVEKEVLMHRVWPDSFVEESNLAVHISVLRKILGEADGQHRIETIPRRGYRFVGEVGTGATVGTAIPETPDQPARPGPAPQTAGEPGQAGAVRSAEAVRQVGTRVWGWTLVATGAVLAALVGGSVWLHERRAAATHPVESAVVPAEIDRIVLADVSNNTGDPVFNTTLRQAMLIELEQSPSLSLISEGHIQQSLKLMGKPANEALTPEVSEEICQRNGALAMVDGWIAKLGTQYVLGVRATNCRTGDHLADLQTTAESKEQVLKALGDVTGQLRAKLGESLTTVQRFNTPIEEATTPSLEALQAYSLGKATMIQKAESASCVPFFQRAIRLDPEFAIAYAALGNAYSNLGEIGLAAENIRRAYELRQRVSEHERLYIESHYYELVTGDLAKATESYQTWAATYPDDVVPRTDLARIDSDLGKFEPSLEQAQEAARIAPDDSQSYENLANAYMALNRLAEAESTIREAMARKLESSDLHVYLYDLAFLRQDRSGMDEQVRWSAGEPGVEDLFLNHSGDTLAYDGKLAAAREKTDRAVEAARRSEEKETAAGYEAEAALREALLGNPGEARRRAQAALALAQDRDTRYAAALALALAGDWEAAGKLADELDKDFPEDTIAQFVYLPAIRGAMALGRKDAGAAIHALESAAPYEYGMSGGMFPVYMRGMAYLEAGDGKNAEAEFEKIGAHAGALVDSPLGPMARLHLARAYGMAGDRDRAKAAYADFLARWKDADADIPVLQAAKAEAGKLQ